MNRPIAYTRSFYLHIFDYKAGIYIGQLQIVKEIFNVITTFVADSYTPIIKT